MTLSIPFFPYWSGAAELLVGRQQGFFEAEGVAVEQVDTEGGGGTIRSVLGGGANVAVDVGSFSALGAFRSQGQARIVGLTMGDAGDLFWFAGADSNYETLDDCTDARIGYSQSGSSTNMVAEAAISRLDAEDTAEAVAVGGTSANVTAVETDEIDLGWSGFPYVTPRIDAGDFQRVFDGSEVPPFDGLTVRCNVCSEDWLSENGETAESFFTAYARARQWAYDNPSEAASIWNETLQADYPDDDLAAGLQEYYFGQPLAEFPRFDRTMELAVQYGFLDEPLSEEERSTLIDTSYLPQS